MSNEESNPSLKVNDRPAAAHQEASTVEPVRVAAAEETENLSASQHPTPTLDFVTLILSLREGALVALGLVSNEELGDLPAVRASTCRLPLWLSRRTRVSVPPSSTASTTYFPSGE